MSAAANPVVTSLETWRCRRPDGLFDRARTGRSPMSWDVVVLRLGTEDGRHGHASALAARSSLVTQTFLLEDAIRVGRDLEQLDYHWFEEPFRDFELHKYAQLCAALDIPIAGTETTRGGPWGVAQAIRQDAVDIVRADVSWKAGITGTLKIAHLAEAHGLRCEIHTTTMGLMDIANLHVSCAVRNCEYFELLVPEEAFRFPLAAPCPIDDAGMIHVPRGPGLGVEVDWPAVAANCIEHKVSQR